MKKGVRITIIVLAVCLFLSLAALVYVLMNRNAEHKQATDTVPDNLISDQDDPNAGTETNEETSNIDQNAVPVTLTFVRLNESCDISPVETADEEGMIESANAASWVSVEPYVAPGNPGNAVIRGYRIWKGETGPFSRLVDLHIGDAVTVLMDNGECRNFNVIEIREFSYDDQSYMNAETGGASTLTLVTDTGDWDASIGMSAQRIVITCEFVG